MGMVTMGMALSHGHDSTTEKVPNQLLDPKRVTPYVDPLPIPEIAKSKGARPDPTRGGKTLPYYRMTMRQFFSQKIHRDLPPTQMWGFESSSPGPIFETRSGEGLLVEWISELPSKHLLPIDHTLHGAERSNPDVRTVIHLHGGKTPPESDGYPDQWFVPGQSQLCHYPSHQDSCLLFYHDHTMGINRLNVYAGLQGLLIIRDQFEDELNLPSGKYEVPLLLYDRNFTVDGQLSYPVSGNPESPWVPEAYGDCVLVNGKLLPYLKVEPRKYRFRAVNGSNARFYHLVFGDDFELHQIGSDQGLLSAPVVLKGVILAPGERADVVFDFAAHAGNNIVLSSAGSAIMQFRVGSAPVRDESKLPRRLRPVFRIPENHAIRTRLLTLDEEMTPIPNADPILRPEDTSRSIRMLLNGTPWHMPVTETPAFNTTEIWEFVNLTEDVHPIHLHLVKFQLLNRRPFDVTHFKKERELRYLAPAIAASPDEAGWKDTIRAETGMATRIIVPFEGFKGRYVWHCHALEHEDNDMMRPYEIV